MEYFTPLPGTLTTKLAALNCGVQPATIRDWVRRGILTRCGGTPKRPLYRLHLKVILPLIERLFLRGAQDFAMIGTYTQNFDNAAAFAEQLRAQGLQVEFHRYFFGCATGVSGRKT